MHRPFCRVYNQVVLYLRDWTIFLFQHFLLYKWVANAKWFSCPKLSYQRAKYVRSEEVTWYHGICRHAMQWSFQIPDLTRRRHLPQTVVSRILSFRMHRKASLPPSVTRFVPWILTGVDTGGEGVDEHIHLNSCLNWTMIRPSDSWMPSTGGPPLHLMATGNFWYISIV